MWKQNSPLTPSGEANEEDEIKVYWLRMAERCLAKAREEQARVKEHIRPAVENYRKLMRHAPASEKPLRR